MLLIHCLESLRGVANIFLIVFISSCSNTVQIRKAEYSNEREFCRKKIQNRMLINQFPCDEVLHSAALQNFKRQDQKF